MSAPDDIPDVPNMDDYEYMGDYNDAERERRSSETHGELVRFLTQSREMRKTATSSLKQSLYAGGGAFAGAFMLGPVGGLIGGIVGSVAGFLRSDEYDGMVLAIVKLEEARKQTLMKEVAAVLITAGAQARQLESADAFREALYRFADQEVVRNGVWRACLHTVNGEGV